MSKIICDICGTSYPESAEQCPICGSTKDLSAALFANELNDDGIDESLIRSKGGLFSEDNVRKRNAVKDDIKYDDLDDLLDGIIDDDEDVEADDISDEDEAVAAAMTAVGPEEFDDEDEQDEDDESEENQKSNAPLIVLLVLVIAALIAVTGYILMNYFLPNVKPAETTAPSTEQVVETGDTTELRIPCDSLALTSGGEVVLRGEGENWLINVMALPENTTDEIQYTSSDESVVTVNAQGKITAVAEGTAVITITCGDEHLTCTVTCNFQPEETEPEETEPEETEPEETEPEETEPEETEPEETEPEETEPEETTEATEPLKDITLKVIKWPELKFNGPNQGFTFQLEGLANNEVTWISLDESVVTVDENGKVLNHGKGKTTIIIQYGEQKLEIPVVSEW